MRRTGTFRTVDPEIVPSGALTVRPIDVQFWAPATFSWLVHGLAAAGRALELHTFRDIYKAVTQHSARQIQRYAGLVIDDDADSSTARLRLSVCTDESCGGEQVHHHVYVSPAAKTLHDGRTRPVDLDNLREVLERAVWGAYLRELRSATTSAGLTWGRPRAGAAYEIVHPALEVGERLRDAGRCRAAADVAERIVLPTDEIEGRRCRDERLVEEERQSGLAY